MFPAAWRSQVRQREDSQENDQRPREERFPLGKDAIGLKDSSKSRREHTGKHTESKAFG